MSSYASKSKTSPTPHLSVRKARVETCRTSHVRAKKRSFERTAKWIRVRRVAARQVISLMQPRRIHPTKCTSLRREGFGGEERRRSTEKKKRSPWYSHSVECTVEKFTPHNRTASSSRTVLQREPYDCSKLQNRHARSRNSART